MNGRSPRLLTIVSCLIFLFGCGRGSSSQSTEAAARGSVNVPTYDIKIGARELAKFENSGFSNDTVPITFVTDGQTYEKARLRFRGSWARGWPKKPLKIFFDHEHQFNHQRCINLNSGWRDPAFIREALAYYVYARCGAVASTSRVVRVTVNGKFRGLYIEVEQPDKPLLERHGLKGAALYKANSPQQIADERDLGPDGAFVRHYEKQTRKTEPHTDLQQFCHELATTSNVRAFFEKRVDLPKYINFLAATILVQNWDGYNKNHFVAHDLKGSGKWYVIPWDLDRTLGDHWDQSFDEASLPIQLGTQQMPGITGWNRLQNKFFSDPTLKAQLADRLQELLRTEFTREKLDPVIDSLESAIRDDLQADYKQWHRQMPDIDRGVTQLKRFVQRRHDYLANEVGRLKIGVGTRD